ncbi:hypothetical protein LPJ61_003085, partial [Coemansia biformis]
RRVCRSERAQNRRLDGGQSRPHHSWRPRSLPRHRARRHLCLYAACAKTLDARHGRDRGQVRGQL